MRWWFRLGQEAAQRMEAAEKAGWRTATWIWGTHLVHAFGCVTARRCQRPRPTLPSLQANACVIWCKTRCRSNGLGMNVARVGSASWLIEALPEATNNRVGG